MDIELLSRMVGDLILSHDSVGLPGLGSFVAEMAPASFSDKGFTINPPYRRLSFYAGHPSDDILAVRYAESNNIAVPEAKAILADYSAQMKQVLHARKTVIFPGLGRLRATKDGKLFFVADEGLDIFPEGFTFEPVSLKFHNESPEAVAQAVSRLSELIAAQTVPPADPAPAVPSADPVPAAPETETAPAPETETAPAPAPEPETDPGPAPEPAAEPAPIPEPAPVKPRRSRWWVPVVATVGAAAVLLGAFAVLGRVAPDFVDTLLYTPEELEILKY